MFPRGGRYRNLIKLGHTKNNNAHIELMAFRVDKQTLSDKLFVKECVQYFFSNVWRKADCHARDSTVVKEYALQ
jgi:hypothetical protein